MNGDPARPYRGRRVLVTGATGVIGSWLACRLVDAGARVVGLALDRDPQSELVRSGTSERMRLVIGDVAEPSTVEHLVAAHDVEVVFHLAAQTIVGVGRRAPRLTLETNVRGTWNLLEACRTLGDPARVVVASSDKAYGDHGDMAYTEDTPLRGREPYEVSKSCTDLVAQSYAAAFGLPVAVARCGNVYGGGDLNWSRLVPGAFAALLHGERFVIRSDGSLLRDYLFVDDVVDAYLCLGAATDDRVAPGDAFNFGEERPRSVLEMAHAIAKVVGCTDLEPVVLGHAVGELRAQHLSSDKARSVLGWAPRVALDAGLAATADWYRAYFSGLSDGVGR